MRCPRCGIKYGHSDIEICHAPVGVHFYCPKCDTLIRVDLSQVEVNRMWIDMDQGNLHDSAFNETLRPPSMNRSKE